MMFEIILMSVLIVIILFFFFACMIASMPSSQDSLNEEAGAREGALLNFHFECPDASGSKLSVRADYQPQSSKGG